MPRSTSLSRADEAARVEEWLRFSAIEYRPDYDDVILVEIYGSMWLSFLSPETPTAPTVSTVLAEGLEKVTYEESRSHEHFDEKVCPICLDGFVDGVVLTKSPCSHVFHGHCLAQWFNRRSPAVCPLCRSPIT